jgi:hypothetical protein
MRAASAGLPMRWRSRRLVWMGQGTDAAPSVIRQMTDGALAPPLG